MNAVTVLRQLPPLVVELRHGAYAWVENGLGFILHAATGRWHPITDATEIGGHVLTPAQVARVVLHHGRPTP